MIRQTMVLLFAGGCLLVSSTDAKAEAKRFSLNAEQSQAEAVHFLTDLIKIDTQDPPGDESKVARYIEDVLKGEGIDRASGTRAGTRQHCGSFEGEREKAADSDHGT